VALVESGRLTLEPIVSGTVPLERINEGLDRLRRGGRALGGDTVTADPLHHFEEEHEVALAALERLERAGEALRGAEPPAPHFAAAREVHGLLCGAVRQHNEDEERALFPVLGEDAPLGPFLEEHEILWRLEADLGGALDRKDRARVARGSIVDLLRPIPRENDALPMARALPARNSPSSPGTQPLGVICALTVRRPAAQFPGEFGPGPKALHVLAPDVPSTRPGRADVQRVPCMDRFPSTTSNLSIATGSIARS
jgi:hypothetical protein